MDKIIDFLRTLKQNYSTDIIYFERIVENEIRKPIEIFIENDKIELYHKITGGKLGNYNPSPAFAELVESFIIFNSPSLRFRDIEKIRPIFEKHKIKLSF